MKPLLICVLGLLSVSTFALPDSVDWRDQGAVTPVKNQGLLDSPWLFSVTGALEGQNFLKTGQLIALSEQELADCVSVNGTTEDAYKYVIGHGLAADADYPHLDDGSCHRESIASAVTEIAYVEVDYDEEVLRRVVAAVGPVAVEVNARAWTTYAGGIFKCRRPVPTNHGALLVGYGSEDGADYWLVKNSWGEEWGEGGYIRVERSIEGDCGITLYATYPVV
ncbi:testin-2-like [Zophobas morio]|uniref:testin-2-like n=1 Tax=Zophobas morio TaxID=2755281 RepID=UPI003082D0FC